MSDDSDWMAPGPGTPQPPRSSALDTTPTPPTPAPSSPYLPPADTAPAGPPSLAGPPPPDSPPLGSEPPSRPRSRKGVLAAAVVTLLAVGGAATFAVTQMSESNSGGASSPEELGQQVLESLENEDVLGLLTMLIPGEQELFRQPAIDFVSELSRLEVLSPAADLAKIAGVDLTIAAGTVTVQETNASDITNLRLTGQISAEVDGEALPIGDLVLDLADGADLSELDDSTSTELELPITAVEVGGRWYLSVFFTAAEAGRAGLEPVPDIPARPDDPIGGAEPEDALDELLDAIEQLDLTAMIAAINPGEAAALQRYAPLFVDDAQAALDEAPIELDFTNAEYTVEGDGDRRHASIDLLTLQGTADGTAFELEYSDGCVTLRAEGEEVDTCDLDRQLPGQDLEQIDDLMAEGPVRDLIDVLTEAFADYDQPGITIVRTDGYWYVSPTGTYLDQLLAVSRALDRSELDAIIEAAPLAAEAFFDEWFGTTGMELDDLMADETFGDEPVLDDVIVPDTVPGTIGDDKSGGGTVPGEEVGDSLARCWDVPDAPTATTCFRDLVTSGAAPATEVPMEMLHPECGAAEAYWDGFDMADAEFFALIDTVRPCFLALVASGEYAESDLATEYTHPECFEGRNWYHVFDDPEYDHRVAACAEQ